MAGRKNREKADKTPRWLKLAGWALRGFSLLDVVAHLGLLVSAEARMAARSMKRLVLLFVCLAVLILSVWGCVQVLLFRYFEAYGWSTNASLGLLLAFNCLLMGVVMFLLTRTRRKISFSVTRDQLKRMMGRWLDQG